MLWTLQDLRNAARLPDAPRLSSQRRDALERRLDALEDLRISAFTPMVQRESRRLPGPVAVPALGQGQMAAAARVLAETSWAMRRQARDPRTLRRLERSSALMATTA